LCRDKSISKGCCLLDYEVQQDSIESVHRSSCDGKKVKSKRGHKNAVDVSVRVVGSSFDHHIAKPHATSWGFELAAAGVM
jgi:hypothetical protein